MDRINISKEILNEINVVLKKYKIPYATNYERRYVQRAIELPDLLVTDRHIQINLVIPNFLDD